MSAAPQNGHALAESLTGIPHAGHLRVTPTGGRESRNVNLLKSLLFPLHVKRARVTMFGVKARKERANV